jgi:hypothetical protein
VLVKIGLEYQLRGNLVAYSLPIPTPDTSALQGAGRRLGREAFVAASNGQPETAFQLSRETLRAGRHLMRSSVGMRGQANDQ